MRKGQGRGGQKVNDTRHVIHWGIGQVVMFLSRHFMRVSPLVSDPLLKRDEDSEPWCRA